MAFSALLLLAIQTTLLFSCQIFATVLTSTGSTVEIGGIPYYVPGQPISSVPSTFYTQLLTTGYSAGSLLTPITVVKAPAGPFSVNELQKTFDTFGGADDVWTPDFLTGKSTSLASQYESAIPPGPYLFSPTGDLYQPCRLYSDIEGAFTQATVPFPSGGGVYSALPATVPGIDSPGVAVPSRLYYTKTPDKPLAGVRTGIKDIYDISGLQTSDGNRAYYALYPPRNETALVVQRLIDAGAIIVGKMKTSQFANGETATADWVDYHEPFNPRGDGYQDTSSSSSGPGSGEGSYPWLDLTLGSDTGGSIRGPSQVQGIYGNRPTHGLAPLTGVMPLAPELDTAGFLCRDPTIWTAAAKVIYTSALPDFPTTYPSKLQTIGFPTASTVPADDVVAQTNTVLLAFLAKLEAFLGTNAIALNYTKLWDQTKPDAGLPGLSVLLNRTYPTLISKEQTKNVRTPFYADYAAKHDGRLPFVDPVPRARWAFGDSLPASELDVAIHNKTLFKDWWESHVLPPGSNDSATCSESLILYTSGVNIVYRNKYLNSPVPPFGFDDSQISIFAEVPDFVIPPARGCDGLLFSLIDALLAANIITIPQAGQTASGGEILVRA
ncbi:uncharacterized protein KY384_001229 [Bacidia gigantensis]|uniref:uncharacterized protein n=1 Tax=Bacidia gigantensis TaxID=2732470 RepID=UPI001D0449E3|nr:uncharacterized protein KY384_001229 [Bacidia gigantensis]KAG8534384.1 hypothetical protein KY384_001229 [Bacidia gigantensis]